jgi:hypothetical protein
MPNNQKAPILPSLQPDIHGQPPPPISNSRPNRLSSPSEEQSRPDEDQQTRSEHEANNCKPEKRNLPGLGANVSVCVTLGRRGRRRRWRRRMRNRRALGSPDNLYTLNQSLLTAGSLGVLLSRFPHCTNLIGSFIVARVSF